MKKFIIQVLDKKKKDPTITRNPRSIKKKKRKKTEGIKLIESIVSGWRKTVFFSSSRSLSLSYSPSVFWRWWILSCAFLICFQWPVTNKQTNKQTTSRQKEGDIECSLWVWLFNRRDLGFAPHRFHHRHPHRACRIYWTIGARERPVGSVPSSSLHLLYSHLRRSVTSVVSLR